MDIRDIMTNGVQCIDPQASVKDAALKMNEWGVGCLPVCDEKNIFGIITDRDIVLRTVAKGDNPVDTRVEDIMTPTVEWCFDDDDISRIVQRMKDKQIRRMLVIDHNKKLIGIVSLGDVSVHGDPKLAEEALERISEPSRPHRRF